MNFEKILLHDEEQQVKGWKALLDSSTPLFETGAKKKL